MAWGGEAYDREHHLLIMPVNNLAAEMRLIPRASFSEEASRGRSLGGDWEFAPQTGTPFGLARRFLRSPSGLPCNAPPWGMLAAVDGDTGELKWKVPLGQIPGAEEQQWGSISLGGPMVTAGGLVFMGGTLDSKIRAFNTKTGELVWTGNLPSSARATPMTYMGPDGKQYVVIAAGGHGIPLTPLTDTLVAFRLK
jgi:quinoprotein glucose dehydrogenase